MTGETNLTTLLQTMQPQLNPGEYVFCTVQDPGSFQPDDVVMLFKEAEACTVVLKKSVADTQQLHYSFVAAWITLTVHSSLEAVGLTAAFSSALAKHGISCNVVAAFYHDHIFVNQADADKAMAILQRLATSGD